MENKNNGLLIGIIVVLVVALLGVCTFVAYDKGLIFNNEKENNEVENNESESNQQQVETEITNTIVKDKLDELVNKFNKTAFHPAWYENGYSIYAKDALSENGKLLVVLKDLDSASKFEKAYEKEATYTIIDLQIVKDEYKKLFNEELTTYSEVGLCPSFKYDAETNKYRAYRECGGTGYDTYISYNNKYTEDENNMYVYVNIGRYASKEMLDQNGNSVLGADLYADVSKEKLYKADVVDRNITINESNYTEFSEYKYTFGKDSDGSIYYKSIEKIR